MTKAFLWLGLIMLFSPLPERGPAEENSVAMLLEQAQEYRSSRPEECRRILRLALAKIDRRSEGALPALEKVLALARSLEAGDLLAAGYQMAADMLAARQDFAQALRYQKLLAAEREKQLLDEIGRRSRQVQAALANEKREKERLLLERDRKIAGLRRGILLFDILLGLAILALAAAFVRLKIGYGRRLSNLQLKLADTSRSMEELLRIDPLTNIYTRRALQEVIKYESVRYERSRRPFALVLLDIDHFGQFNETYGRETGDFVLAEIAAILKESLRRQDRYGRLADTETRASCVGRWEGEEFLLFLPETDLKGGRVVAEKLRRRIANHAFLHEGKVLALTMSFGVSVYLAQEDVADSIRRAEQAMRQGKDKGGNLVVAAR